MARVGLGRTLKFCSQLSTNILPMPQLSKEKEFLRPKEFQIARKRLLKMHFESGVGHIGGNLSALDTLLIVFHEYIGENDKFILSKGHSAGALYIALWSAGRLEEQHLELFHKDDTLLAGHPPAEGIPDIPFATGSLGHGLSLAAGTALAFKLKGTPERVFCMTVGAEVKLSHRAA